MKDVSLDEKKDFTDEHSEILFIFGPFDVGDDCLVSGFAEFIVKESDVAVIKQNRFLGIVTSDTKCGANREPISLVVNESWDELCCICLKKVDSQKESIIMTPHTEFQKKYYQQVIEIHQKTGFSPRKIAELQLVPVSVRQMYHWIAIFEAENGKGSPRRIMEAKKSKEQEELESLKSRISELEESLRVERLRNRLNEKIIDIAEARWHIEIRKKAGTKR